LIQTQREWSIILFVVLINQPSHVHRLPYNLQPQTS